MASDTQKTQFKIGGMSCSFCTRSIEDALGQMSGVKSVSVSLSHEEALVEYEEEQTAREDLKKTLTDLGYSIRDPDKIKAFEEQQEELRTEKQRLITAGVGFLLFMAPIIYVECSLLPPLGAGLLLLGIVVGSVGGPISGLILRYYTPGFR